jgi:putative thioredoxin
MSQSPFVVDIDIKNFEQEIILRSAEVPVVVDFHAEWCEPCKVLGPALEKLADEMGGRFVLAKVDVDANPELAQAFRVQSVPMVMLLKDGKPLDAFTGALPEAQLRSFLEPHLGEAPGVGPLEEAARLEEEGRSAEALALLEPHLAADPEDGAARIAVTRLLLEEGEAERARTTFDRLAEADRESPEASAVAARLELLEGAGDIEGLRADLESDPRDVGKRIELGRALVAEGRTEEGLEELLSAAMRDLAFADGAARKAMLEVFQALGSEDPLTLGFQQRLSVLLCS